MCATRITVDLIDADGCTFNMNYRQRILFCIEKYRHILDEFSQKEALTPGEADLMAMFKRVVMDEQKTFSMSKADYKLLIARSEEQAKTFATLKQETELDNRTASQLLSGYIYYYIKCMELVCPEVVRLIYQLSNEDLIHKIKAHASQVDQEVVMLGSNRQCHVYDQINMKDRGTSSIYVELDALVKSVNDSLGAVKIKLDKLTLADLHDKEPSHGKNFKQILKRNFSENKNAFDKNKINIIYAMAHHCAKKYMNAEIVINLWDDIERIIRGIKRFYTIYPDLLPSNVQINLCRYTGKLHKTKTIKGVGVVDADYKINTVLMAVMSGFDASTAESLVDIAENLNVDEFRKKRAMTKEIALSDNSASYFARKKSSQEYQLVPVATAETAITLYSSPTL